MISVVWLPTRILCNYTKNTNKWLEDKRKNGRLIMLKYKYIYWERKIREEERGKKNYISKLLAIT